MINIRRNHDRYRRFNLARIIGPEKFEPRKLEPRKLKPEKFEPEKFEPRKLEPEKFTGHFFLSLNEAMPS